MVQSHKPSSIGEIAEKIIEIEKELNLFEWEINTVRIWEIIRYKVYLSTVNSCFLSKPNKAKSFTSKIVSVFKKIQAKISKIHFALKHHPFCDDNGSEVLVFESSRKLIYGKEYIDPYTKFTCDELISNGVKITKYQSSYTYDKLSVPDAVTKHLELMYMLAGFKSIFVRVNINPNDKEVIKKLQNVFKSKLACHINFKKLIEGEIKSFVTKKKLFVQLLTRKKPGIIFIVNFCDKPALISGAKELGIEVADIQHGLISSDDLIYHYPHCKKGSLKYFPDKFLIWSELWRNICELPLINENIVVYGNRYLENKSQMYKSISKQTDMVLIISQPGLTKMILTETINNIERLSGKTVYFKFHPNEYYIGDKYPECDILKQEHHVKFIERDVDLYEYMAKAPMVIGVSSTALYEALYFNCKVFLFNLPGVEWMGHFTKSNLVSYLSNLNES